MRIILHYKDCSLGELTYDGKNYIYNSLDGEKIALKKYCALIEYNLQSSKNLMSENLFPFIKENFINDNLQREDILQIVKKDAQNDFDFLVNLCKLNTDKFSFWISLEKIKR